MRVAAKGRIGLTCQQYTTRKNILQVSWHIALQMSFMLFRKDFLEGQTQPPYPICPDVLSKISCLVIWCSVGHLHLPSLHLAVLLATHWKLVDSEWAINSVLTSQECLAMGALHALEGMYASAAGFATVLSPWKGRLALRPAWTSPKHHGVIKG